MKLTESTIWKQLSKEGVDAKQQTSIALMAADTKRLSSFEITLQGLRYNYAFQHISAQSLKLLIALAEAQDVSGWRAKMFSGEKINETEKRAVLHTALRRQDLKPTLVDGEDVMPAVKATRERVAAFVNAVREGAWTGATGKRIRHVVNIGIGGSDLGPRLVTRALDSYASVLETHFVANADAFELKKITKALDPEETLFVVASKTFTTQETLLNARSARRWLTQKLGEKAVSKHFVAVSVNATEVEKFGIDTQNMFPMWDWVGGRFSVWSAVGLTVALALGNEKFSELLSGAAAMDDHFCSAPLAQNMPIVMAMLGVWNRNFLDAPALAILPYCERLRDLPRFLQQLEMESNGKSVTREGVSVDYDTAPALFGECGTVGQHSFHQWLHQGSTVIPADFIAVSTDDLGEPEHHSALLSNMVAQIGALAFGQPAENAPQELYSGRRSSSVIMLEKLDPMRMGMLIALYEHKTFVQGIIWNINSFDQPGVELGKKMAKGLTSKDEGTGKTSEEAQIMASFYKTL